MVWSSVADRPLANLLTSPKALFGTDSIPSFQMSGIAAMSLSIPSMSPVGFSAS